MEYRPLGGSGLRVPVLSLGTATWGGEGEFFEAWGMKDPATLKGRRLLSSLLFS